MSNKLLIKQGDRYGRLLIVNEEQQGQLPAGDKFRQFNCKCCLLYTSPSPRDRQKSRMPSSA